MTELGGLLWLAAGLGGLLASAGLGACCLRIRSPVEFALATYVLAWTWLVAVTLGLSPARLVTRGWLIGGIGAGLLSALGVWLACGRPGPPDLRPALKEVRQALHSPALLILALAVILGAAYSIALALFTPVNEGDSLSYHLARAALWKQEHGLGYVPNAVDIRLNGNPPNAEIGQLATMLLSGSDRYVALPQLGAYEALVLCVAGLARRLGLSVSEALFGALAFATLPVVVLQASGALNDLVVASFLAVAALFCLRPGRSALVLVALAIGLALGTKLTTVLALPTLAIVVALGRPRRQWLAVALAGLGGLAVGSVWYVVNLAETGELDGGLAGASDQGVELSVPAVSTNAMRLSLDVIDMSGAPRPYSALFLAAACVVAVLGLWRARHSIHQGLALLLASALTASIFFTPHLVDVGQDTVFRAWIVLGRPATAPFERGWNLNVEADPVLSWYGPLVPLLLVIGTVAIAMLWLRKQLPTMSLGLTLAPWMLVLTFTVTIVWDPWRGRFLVFGVALAAATWGVFLRSRIVAGATAAIGTTALLLSLANYLGKPSGINAIWPRSDNAPASLQTIWDDRRWEAQARLRPGGPEGVLFRYFEDKVPADANVAVAPRENDLLSPYFGMRFSRHVSLVRSWSDVPARAEWLVVSPQSGIGHCRAAWQRELTLAGWRIERRIGADECLTR